MTNLTTKILHSQIESGILYIIENEEYAVDAAEKIMAMIKSEFMADSSTRKDEPASVCADALSAANKKLNTDINELVTTLDATLYFAWKIWMAARADVEGEDRANMLWEKEPNVRVAKAVLKEMKKTEGAGKL